MYNANNISPTVMVDVTSETGKGYLQKLEGMLSELKMVSTKSNDETFKKIKRLSEQDVKKYPFLLSFMDAYRNGQQGGLLRMLKLKAIILETGNRKTGAVHKAKDQIFRFFMHFGEPEVYELSSPEVRSKKIPLKSGWGFIVPSYMVDTECRVDKDPIRTLPPGFNELITKIRLKNYRRVTVIFEYELDLEALEQLEKEEAAQAAAAQAQFLEQLAQQETSPSQETPQEASISQENTSPSQETPQEASVSQENASPSQDIPQETRE